MDKPAVGDRVITVWPCNGPPGLVGTLEWIRPEGDSSFCYYLVRTDLYPEMLTSYYEDEIEKHG